MPKTKPLPVSGQEFEVRYLTRGQMRTLREKGLFGDVSMAQAEAVRDDLLASALAPEDQARLDDLAFPDALALVREILRLNYADPEAEGNS